MEKRIIKKLLAVMMVITILATDFFVLGSSLVTYAAQVTNEIEGYPNIHFSTYFKEENEVKQINKSIKDNELKLYAKVGVSSDVDYLENIQLKLKGDNFNIVSSNKGTVEENTVKLDYIPAGSTVEVELNIEPVFSNKVPSDMLVKAEIELNAKYIHADAPEGEIINATSEATVKYQPDDTTKADLVADIITNQVLAINGENKRVIQVLVKSRLTNNEYPVKQTILNVTIPNLGESTPQVNNLVIGQLATSGKTEIDSITTENGKAKITLNNNIDENNQVSWIKNAYDEIVITYIYPEDVDASRIEITADSEISLHGSGNTYTATYTKGIVNQEPNNVIMERTEITTEEMYKGQLYANIDTEYSTKTSIVITNAQTENEVSVHEGPDTFVTSQGEIPANTKYVTTKINLEKMLYILGQDGSMEIKNGETTTTINKNSAVDSEGNVVISHQNSTSELDIKTSKPVNAGVLEINHIKVIEGNAYTREELQAITTLKTTGSAQSTIELKETVSKIELTTNRTTFSATQENEVTLGIKLITDGAKYDLYKNPSISIQFPETVENVEFVDEPNLLYADEFTITSKNYNSQNHILTINMSGEQTAYPESALTQSYIQLKLKVTLSQYVMSQSDKIVMTYINENATQYENGETNGIVEQPIQISAPSELIKIFNINTDTNTSLTEKILQQVNSEDAGRNYSFNITLINNKDSDMSNIEIIGKLPTAGNTITEESANTLETTLRSVTAQNATIYYTENSDATTDVENAENGWTTTLLPNAKLYLIKLDNLARGGRFTGTVTVQMPNPVTENAISYTEYEVYYDTDTNSEVKETSRKIGLISSLAASINVETLAQVGGETLNSGDAVKEGEVIKYTVKLRNNGIETLTNINLKLDVPEGTVYVTPLQRYVFGEGTDEETVITNGGYVYAEGVYYEEITDSKKLSELTNLTISELLPGNEYVVDYEVRVNKGTAGNEISNKAVVTFNGTEAETEEIKNRVEEANIRVTVKRAVDVSEQLYPNGNAEFVVIIENLSDSKIKNLELQLNAEGFTPGIITTISEDEELSGNIHINEIEAKGEEGTISYTIYGKIAQDVEEMSINAVVKDSDGKTYRSNEVTEYLPKVDATVSMSSPQNGALLKEGDIVEYNITVKNIGNIESVIEISDVISEHLKAETVTVNGEEITVSNNINYPVVLQPQEQASMHITARVDYIPLLYHGKTISNVVTIKAIETDKTHSETITHVLQSSDMLDDSLENIISGSVWYDANGNGVKDENEKYLSGIIARLYDTTGKHYLTDEYGNAVEIVTESNGEFTFTKIPSGSYTMIFEYNNQRYEVSIGDLNSNKLGISVGLKESDKQIQEEQPDVPGNTDTDPENPNNSNDSDNSNNSENVGGPGDDTNLRKISGLAWLDSDRDGQKDDEETLLSGIRVKLYNVTTGENIAETITDENGKYEFSNIEKGSYIIIFEYDKDEYEPTAYKAEGVDSAKNSKAVLNNITLNGQETVAAVTDIIDLQNNVNDINIGLKENLIFDLELNKYISKIVVQTSKNTKTYDEEEDTLAKVEINKKQLQGANVVLEYTIRVKNTGEISGYASNIVDYLPSGLTFSSELNSDWYLSGNYLYTKSLENVELQPGEEKEIKLILTKSMTGDNVGLVNNRAEIYQDYNKYGEADVDSTPNNQAQNEDDFSSVDVIIQVATGGSDIAYMTLFIINVILIGFAIELMIKKRIIKLPSRKWRK